MRRIKVALIHKSIAPYRHALFEELSQILDLTVYYCSVKQSSSRWNLWPINYVYRHEILARIRISIRGVEELNINPFIIKRLIRDRPHVTTLGGYVDPTMCLAFVMSKVLKIPVIYWTESVKEPVSILGALTRPLREMFVKKSNAIIVPGKLSVRHVLSLGSNPEKVFVAPNCIDNNLFLTLSQKHQKHKNTMKRLLGFEDKVVILYVGQLIKRKGVEYLLKAYAKLKQECNNAALLVLGDGPLKAHLESLAELTKLKDFKIVESRLNTDELTKLYSAADVFVLPTLDDIWGFVVNEAMACGLPVIATRASQAAMEIVQDGVNGYVVKEANTDELYYALTKLVTSADLREAMGKKSAEIIGEFNVKSMVKGFLSAIEYAMAY